MYSEWARDEIHIDGLEVFAHHGVYEEEQKIGRASCRERVLRLV